MNWLRNSSGAGLGWGMVTKPVSHGSCEKGFGGGSVGFWVDGSGPCGGGVADPHAGVIDVWLPSAGCDWGAVCGPHPPVAGDCPDKEEPGGAVVAVPHATGVDPWCGW